MSWHVPLPPPDLGCQDGRIRKVYHSTRYTSSRCDQRLNIVTSPPTITIEVTVLPPTYRWAISNSASTYFLFVRQMAFNCRWIVQYYFDLPAWARISPNPSPARFLPLFGHARLLITRPVPTSSSLSRVRNTSLSCRQTVRSFFVRFLRAYVLQTVPVTRLKHDT